MSITDWLLAAMLAYMIASDVIYAMFRSLPK